MEATIITEGALFDFLKEGLEARRQSFPNGSSYIDAIYWRDNVSIQHPEFGLLEGEEHNLRPGVVQTIMRLNGQHVKIVRGGKGKGTELGTHFCNRDQVTLAGFEIEE